MKTRKTEELPKKVSPCKANRVTPFQRWYTFTAVSWSNASLSSAEKSLQMILKAFQITV